MSVKCLDALHKNCRSIYDCARELDHLAGSFSDTGNRDMARLLNSISQSLETAQDAITAAYADDIHENMIRAEESSANMVKAALSSITGPQQ